MFAGGSRLLWASYPVLYPCGVRVCARVCVSVRAQEHTCAQVPRVGRDSPWSLVPSYVSFEVRSVHARP